VIRSAAIILITLAGAGPLILGNLLWPGGKFARGAARCWAKVAMLVIGARVKTEGLDLLPKGGFVLVANHQSFVDIPLLVSAFPKRSMVFVMHRWLLDVPVFGRVTKDVGSIIVGDGDARAAAAAIRKAAAEVGEGKIVVVFPEGTRSKDGSVGEFKPGALAIAAKAGNAVGLVAISGGNDILPRGSLRVRSGPITLRYAGTWTPGGKKIFPEDVLRLRKQITEAMDSGAEC